MVPGWVQAEVEKLGWSLLHFLWQGTVIVALYAAARRLTARWLSPQARYVLACAALLAMAVSPALTFLLIGHEPTEAGWNIPAADSQRLLTAVVALWIAGVLAFSIRLLGGWRFTARLLSLSNGAAREWQQTLDRLGGLVGVRRAVRLLVSPLVEVPTVIGWLRPAILLPVDFLAGLPAGHIDALLAHELAHIRRHDYLANILQRVAETLLFYHPGIWWISEQIRAEREKCCDDLAVAVSGDALAYARALAELELRQPRMQTLVPAANGGVLVDRIRRLIEPAHATAEKLPGAATAWAMTLLWLVGIAMALTRAVPATGPTVPAARRTPMKSAAHVRPLVTVAVHARDTLLYDPLLRTHTAARAFIRPAVAVSRPRVPVLAADPPPLANDAAGDFDDGLAKLAKMPAIPAPPPAEPAVIAFRAATRLVQIDVVARRGGSAAKGLNKDDFVVLDNGRPQQIALFSADAQLGGEEALATAGDGAVSNRLAGAANGTVVLMDQTNTSPSDQAVAIRRVADFLRGRGERRPTTEPIGIYVFGRQGTPRVIQELTTEPALLSEAADTLRRLAPFHNDAADMVERAIETSDCVQAVARHLAGVPGRKNLIWISSGFPLMAMAGSDVRADFNPQMEAAARALTDAGVAFYAVDARGLAGAAPPMAPIPNAESPGPQLLNRAANFSNPISMPLGFTYSAEVAAFGAEAQRAGPENSAFARLADLTGGLAFFDSNAIDDSIGKALDDASHGYTLAFYAETGGEDGAWHTLKVRVKQRRINLRYREKYFAPGTAGSEVNAASLRTLLKDPLEATGIELTARAAPDRQRPGFGQVHVSIDLHHVHLENQDHCWVGAVDVAFLKEGARAASLTEGRLRIPEDRLAGALENGLTIDDSIAMDDKPGALHIVAQDRATGLAGTVRLPPIER